MNSEYMQVRFRAEVPESGVPRKFGVVTAHNPDGVVQSIEGNNAATERLGVWINDSDLACFPVTGGSPDFAHQEPGFGVVTEIVELVIELGRRFRQEAVFWVEDGDVHLVPCAEGKRRLVGRWDDLQLKG